MVNPRPALPTQSDPSQNKPGGSGLKRALALTLVILTWEATQKGPGVQGPSSAAYTLLRQHTRSCP